MIATQASRTAMLAAAGRALHLFHHGPQALVQDWLAWPLLSSEAEDLVKLGKALLDDERHDFVTWLAARSRLSEDWLAESGVSQHLVLGAGLDSTAWRHPHLRTIEVDHPDTQAWKRARAEALDLAGGPVWVGVDFERDRLGDALADAGVDVRGSFVSWHGVVPYLTAESIIGTLQALPDGLSLAVSYVVPEAEWDDRIGPLAAIASSLAADAGEPWLSLLTAKDMADLLSAAGFSVTDDVGPESVEARFGLPAVGYERIALARSER